MNEFIAFSITSTMSEIMYTIMINNVIISEFFVLQGKTLKYMYLPCTTSIDISPAYNICHHMTKTLTFFDKEYGMQQAQVGIALIYTTVIPNSSQDHHLQ